MDICIYIYGYVICVYIILLRYTVLPNITKKSLNTVSDNPPELVYNLRTSLPAKINAVWESRGSMTSLRAGSVPFSAETEDIQRPMPCQWFLSDDQPWKFRGSKIIISWTEISNVPCLSSFRVQKTFKTSYLLSSCGHQSSYVCWFDVGVFEN